MGLYVAGGVDLEVGVLQSAEMFQLVGSGVATALPAAATGGYALAAVSVAVDRRCFASADDEDIEYHPIVDFADHPPPGPVRPCSEYVLVHCQECMPEATHLEASVQESSKITRSKLENPCVKAILDEFAITAAMLFAIVLYTFDLSLIVTGSVREECFFYVLNEKLRKREGTFLKNCHGYLYYLMTGLCKLPPYSKSECLYRYIDAKGAARARAEYRQGRSIHWSGFSSASTEPQKSFGAGGGLLIRIWLAENSRSRDLALLSAFPNEKEVLLLPNFKAMVSKKAHEDASLGAEVIDLIEAAEESVDVF